MQTAAITVIARDTFTYDGITRRAGESFDASVKDARVLSLIGRVDIPGDATMTDPEQKVETPRRSYRRPAQRLISE